jgi:hypothetical protein
VQILAELESRHGQPEWLQTSFIKELYSCQFPGPGQGLKLSTANTTHNVAGEGSPWYPCSYSLVCWVSLCALLNIYEFLELMFALHTNIMKQAFFCSLLPSPARLDNPFWSLHHETFLQP